MSVFDHFLLTRFSAVLRPDGEPVGEDWLRYRLAFFYDAALPSVESQRNALFTWLVLFDDRCPDSFRAEVEGIADEGAFPPIWSHEPFLRDSFAGHVAARSDAPYLITTRMDSDDAIATDFMASVQRQFASQERLFVNFTRGVQLDRGGWVYRCDQVSSPFLSLIERRTPGVPPLTVYAAKHARARGFGPVREVKAPPMWVQVVHDANVSNIITGTRMSPAVVNDRFVMDLGYRREVPAATLVAEQVAQRARLARLWWAHPGELTRYVEARFWRLRGTHTRPQADSRTLTDLLRMPATRLGLRR